MAYRYKNFAQWKNRHGTSKFTLHPNLDCPLVREAMPKIRFMGLKQHLHFIDNFKISNNCSNKGYKIRTLLTCLNKNFMQFDYLYSDYSVK